MTAHRPAYPPIFKVWFVRLGLVAGGLYLAWSMSNQGPKVWHETPSLRWLHQMLPWTLLAIAFLAYSLLLLIGGVGCSIIAYLIGMVLFTWEFVALVVTTDVHKPTNPIAVVAVFFTLVFHLRALIVAVFERESA